MNRIYKVIWSKVKNQYVVVSELAHSNGKQSSKSEHISVGGSLRTLAAALMIGGSLLFMPYTASAADSYQLQNGEGVITVDGNNLNDFFMEAVQNEDGSYTIIFEDGTSAAVAEENLYNVGDKLGAFVTTNEDGTKAVYTDDVLDENSTKVVPAKNHVVTNEEGFYVNNGKGTYNTLNKDGLWVGGTNDEEGLHVDDKGNIETTGNAEFDGAVTDGSVTTGNVQINTDRNNTITGLSNTTWTPENPDSIVANRAATEGQLSTVQEDLDTLDNLAVKYTDTNKTAVDIGSAAFTTTGSITGGSVAVDDVTINDNKITGLADGDVSENSTEAVNGSQLYEVQGDIDTLDDLAVKYTDTNKTAVDIGSAAFTTTGSITGGSVVVDDVTIDDNKITGLADGDVSENSTEAVNGSQLYEVQGDIDTLDDLAVKYTDTNKTAVDIGSATFTTTGTKFNRRN